MTDFTKEPKSFIKTMLDNPAVMQAYASNNDIDLEWFTGHLKALLNPLKVVLRVDSDGDICMFYLNDIRSSYPLVCYHWIGQHGEASLEYYRTTRPFRGELPEHWQRFLSDYDNDAPVRIMKRLQWGNRS